MSLTKNKVAIVPGCVLCPSFQAVENEKTSGWSFQILECLMEQQYNIVPLICPEMTYNSMKEGRTRSKHGVDYYSKDVLFVNHCKDVAKKEAIKIKEMVEAGFSVDFILGIENSPTCAVHYMYTHNGIQHRMGIFYDFLCKELLKMNIELSFIGINRGHLNKAFSEISDIVHGGENNATDSS